MKKLSKAQWQNRIIDLAQSLPKDMRPDDHTLLHMLTDIIVAEQARIKPQSLALLAGVAAAILDRVVKTMPAASHVTTNGDPVYTETQIAAHLGVSLDEVRRVTAEIAETMPDDGLLYVDVDPASLHRVN